MKLLLYFIKSFILNLLVSQVFRVNANQSFRDKKDAMILFWYKRYGHELKSIHGKAKEYCSQDGIQCLSDTLEIELTYLRIRSLKPKTIWEISPSHGYSTLWICEAVAKNANNGVVLSFDIEDRIGKHAIPEWYQLANWNLILGDARQTYKDYIVKHPPEYIFLDSFHSAEFGEFYKNDFFPNIMHSTIRTHIPVSLHDVYNPSFWTDGKDVNLRKRANLPVWMANEEGQVVLDWILYHPKQACCVFNVAPSHNRGFVENIVRTRREVLTLVDGTYPIENDEKLLSENNPTLYFTLIKHDT